MTGYLSHDSLSVLDISSKYLKVKLGLKGLIFQSLVSPILLTK